MELILFAMLMLVVIVAMLASRLNDNSFPFPFDQKTTVFTGAEKNFQILLEQAIGPKFRVLNRVKLSDIVSVRNGVSQKTSQVALNNANNRYLDFVICDRETMTLCGAVDLVDTAGKGYKVKKDWFVSGALEAASIPHVRIKVKSNYTLEEIRACINSRFLQKFKPVPKVKGRVIPAPMVKARSKNTGVLPSAAIDTPTLQHKTQPQSANAHLAEQLKNAQPAAMPH